MAIHNSASSMSQEAIDEFLEIARYCVSTEKHAGGVYGYAAVLLLFSLIDAFGNYQRYPKHSSTASIRCSESSTTSYDPQVGIKLPLRNVKPAPGKASQAETD